MKKKIKTKKGIAPMVTVILIVVVAVILGTILLTWSRETSSSSLNETKAVTSSQANPDNYVYPESVDDGEVSLNYSPSSEIEYQEVLIIGYKVIADNMETIEVTLEDPVPLEEGSNVINLEGFADLEITASTITVILITSDNKFITLENIPNTNIPVRKVATPIADPGQGSYSYTMISLSTSTEDANIHYTTDGSTPTTESPTYSSAIEFYGADMTLQAMAVKEGYENSDVFYGVYIYEAPQR